MPTAAIQIKLRIKNTLLRRCLILFSLLFTAFMVIGRILAGVHWITDIIGGLLLSAGLVTAYTCLY
jgi:undecaprenyl-diphosphatase